MRPAALALLAAIHAAPTDAAELAVRASSAFDGARDLAGVTVVVRAGRIADITPVAPRGIPLTEVDGAVLTPGLIDAAAELGLEQPVDESSEASSPDVSLLHALAPDDLELEAFRRSGVTSAWISPGRTTVVAGHCPVVQPGPRGDGLGVLHASWGVTGSLAAAARIPDRAPTSLPGQAALLFEDLPARSGALRVRVDDAASGRLSAARAAALVGLPEPGAWLTELDGARGFVTGGLGPDAPASTPGAVVALARRLGARRLAFGSLDQPLGPASIRLAAARCVEGGLSREDALTALTLGAATVTGLEDRGRLAPGAAADLVLWSADPILPASRPLVVWVGGREVYRED
jgi:N-acyl-D-aspartate/D-glutamate deacylase